MSKDIDWYADQYFSRVYDSPEERAARLEPPKEHDGNDDDFDRMRDERHLQYDPKACRWGSWDT